jgi:transcriptional regulator with GAF, ATPase, and Fis domain
LSGERDATFFLKLAEMNLRESDLEPVLASLESALSRRPKASELERLAGLARKAVALAERGSDARALERAHALAAATPAISAPAAKPSAAAAAPPPPPSPPPPAPPSAASGAPAEGSVTGTTGGSGSTAIEVVRRLLVSPEVVERLKALVGPRATPREAGPIALPVADVVGRILGLDLDVRATADLALELVVSASGAERGFLILGQDARFGTKGFDRPPETSEGILKEVERTRATVLVEDAQADPRFAGRASVERGNMRSVLCVPVFAQDELVGTIYLDSTRAAGAFGARERELAEALSGAIGPALRNARRFEERGVELARARRAWTDARRRRGESEGPRLVGTSKAMQQLDALLDRVAPGSHTVLVEGESGTGKELVARALHARSERAKGPFVAENVSALSETLLEAELFGHAKGAFTGAGEARPGLFQVADKGTIFLDEVGDMSEGLQKRLLRVLQEREVRPVGATSAVRIDVRVIAATNRDLEAMVKDGEFREDLFYRLGVVRVRVPSLRERREDIPLLLGHFLARAAESQGRPVPRLEPALMDRLTRHAWPGNVRELEGLATRILIEGPGTVASIGETAATDGSFALLRSGSEVVPIREAKAIFEKAYVARVLEDNKGNVSATARLLGMNRAYLSGLVNRMGLRETSEGDD